MNIKKPKFWDYKKPNTISLILIPFSLLFEFINFIKHKIINGTRFSKIKTICVGNIYLGGTGKTSLSIRINEILEEKKIKSCFIKKDYFDQIDEQKILEAKGKLIKSNKRINGIKKAIEQNFEIAIFDDGLQDLSIDYDLSIVCFNSINWIGNGLTIPSGPLREKIENLKKYEHVFINGNLENLDTIKEHILKINPKINIYTGKYVPINLNDFDKKNDFIVFSGIGNHQTFVSMLKKNEINIIKEIEFPDHYNYLNSDIENIILLSKKLNCKIITTEKDFIRLRDKKFEEIKFVKSRLEIIEKKKFLETISKLYE